MRSQGLKIFLWSNLIRFDIFVTSLMNMKSRHKYLAINCPFRGRIQDFIEIEQVEPTVQIEEQS